MTDDQGKKLGNSIRLDIQALRALSVLVVVLYHAGFAGFKGGFTGVDVFFVISGFLICGMLRSELLTTGRINVLRFWQRRAQRILPNALLVLLVVVICGAILFPAYMREKLAREVLSAVFYFANFEFASKAVDYFLSVDPPSPVLHFWSLNVEEQFYFVLPLLFLLTVQAGQKLQARLIVGILTAILVLSFAAGILLVEINQPLAFFHSGTRAWQLAAGGLLACWVANHSVPRGVPAMALIASGLGLIIMGVAFLDDTLSLPGWYALVPTMGTLAVIMGGSAYGSAQHQNPAHKLYANSAVQWLGERSYSWYLWHWPAIVFTQLFMPENTSILMISVVTSLVISHVTFQFFEQPLRQYSLSSIGSRHFWAFVTSAMTAVAGSAYASAMLFMSSNNVALDERLKASSTDRGRIYQEKCHLDYSETTHSNCSYGNTASSTTVVLFGDSHAAQWFAPLEEAAGREGWKLISMTKSSCPSADVTVWFPPKKAPFKECDIWRENMFRELRDFIKPTLIILANSSRYDGWLQDRKTGDRVFKSRSQALYREGLARTVNAVSETGSKVVIIRDTPQAYKTFSLCLAQGDVEHCARPRSQALPPDLERKAIEDAALNARLIDFTNEVCDPLVCPVMRGEKIIYVDYHHLSASYALTLAPQFQQLLRQYSTTP